MIGVAEAIGEDQWSSLLALAARHVSLDEAMGSMGLDVRQTAKLRGLFGTVRWEDAGSCSADMRDIYAAFRRRSTCDIVWDGRTTIGAAQGCRNTFAVASNILGRARDHAIIAGYDVRLEILERLGYRAANVHGARLTVLSSQNDFDEIAIMTLRANGVRVLSAGSFGGMSKFHLKVIAADYNVALVTSANFTFQGQGANVEMGVRIDGEPAATVMRILMEYAEGASLSEP